ncbi:MAG: succinate dehydrogenase cytochrome b subunit [Rikenellaceae bacterium]
MCSYLINSSIGKKLVMSLSGMALVLFVVFHMSMNLAAIFSGEAYNAICAFLGANWYALIATAGLAVLVLVHFIYALILTRNNYAARGNIRYAVTVNEPGVEWNSKNMLVLGWVVLGGLLIHLCHFWSKMQLVEILHGMGVHVHAEFDPTDGAGIIKHTFSQWYNVVIYLVWFAGLWFHLTHGVWSMLQSVGVANDVWYPRLKVVSTAVATLIFLGFAAVVIYAFVSSNFCVACC